MLSGVALGRLSDRYGRFRCYLISLSCEGVLAIACSLGGFGAEGAAEAEGGAGRPFTTVFALVLFMGVGNTGSQTMMKAIIGDLFDAEETGVGLSAYMLLSSIATTIGFFVGPVLSLQVKATALLTTWLAAALGIACASHVNKRSGGGATR